MATKTKSGSINLHIEFENGTKPITRDELVKAIKSVVIVATGGECSINVNGAVFAVVSD